MNLNINYYKKLLISVALSIVFFPFAALSQDELEEDLLSLYGDDDLVTIATGTAKHVRLAPSVASVITKEDIQASGARFLTDVLKSVPGIHIGNGLLFNDEQISIRGIQTSNNPHVLVLIDGVAIRNLFTAGRPSGWRLPTKNIERVEVVRGPGSAVYGADAFAGVINVITKDASQISTQLKINGGSHSSEMIGGRVGSFDTQDAWFQKGYAGDRVSAAFSHEYSKSDGDENRVITSDGFGQSGVFRTEYEINNTMLKASVDDFTLNYHRWELSNGGNGAGGAQVLDPRGGVEYVTNQWNLGYKSTFDDHWVLEVNSGYGHELGDIENVLLPAGSYEIVSTGNNTGNLSPAPDITVAFPEGAIGNPSTESRITHFNFAVTNDTLGAHVFRLASGYRHEDFDTSETKNFGPGVLDPNVITTAPSVTSVSNTPDVFIPDVNREVYFISTQYEGQLADDWSLTLGVRYDNYSDVGDTFNPRAALVWAVDYNLTAKLLYGRAFRAPSFSELFSQNNPAQIGNTNLDPEVIDVYELAFDFQLNQVFNTQLNIFYYEIDGLVDFTPNLAAQGLLAQNALDQNGYGVEIAYSWDVLKSVTWQGNFSWHHIENSQTKNDVADVPTRQAYSSIRWRPMTSTTIAFESKWIGERDRAIGDIRSNIGGYAVSNIVASKQCDSTGIDLSLIIKNVFDKNAVEPEKFRAPSPFVSSDYPIEGRSVFLEVGYNLPI